MPLLRIMWYFMILKLPMELSTMFSKEMDLINCQSTNENVHDQMLNGIKRR